MDQKRPLRKTRKGDDEDEPSSTCPTSRSGCKGGSGNGSSVTDDKAALPKPKKGSRRKLLKRTLAEREELGRSILDLTGRLAELNSQISSKQETIDQLTIQVQQHREPAPSSIQAGSQTMEEPQLEGPIVLVPAKTAASVFPEEIWEMILKNVTDPNDLESCTKTCPLYDKILHPLKNHWRFHLAFPTLDEYLRQPVVLKCRTICKQWNVAVDTFVESDPSRRPFESGSFRSLSTLIAYPRALSKWTSGYRFGNDGGDLRERNFLGKMGDHPRNPIIGRALTVMVTEYKAMTYFEQVRERNGVTPFMRGAAYDYSTPLRQQQQEFWQALYNFLEAFGKHIWHFQFNIGVIHEGGRGFLNRQSQYAVCRLLSKDLFNLVPNLRTLEINGLNVGRYVKGTGGFPHGPELESLRYDTDGDKGHPIFVSLFDRHYQQLKRLQVQWETLSPLLRPELELPHLKELHVTADDPKDQLVMKDVLLDLKLKLPQLEIIGFKLHSRYRSWANDFHCVMSLLNQLSPLTKLHTLQLDGGFDDEGISELDLPNLYAPATLTTLEVRGSNEPFNYLLAFPFLENLTLVGGCFHYGERYPELVEMRTIYDKHHNMYRSNVWKLLPRLQVLTLLDERVHTRQDWQLFSERRGMAEANNA